MAPLTSTSPYAQGGWTGYVAAPGLAEELAYDLGPDAERHSDLFLAPGPERFAPFAQDVWFEVERRTIRSIGDAAKQLRAVQRNWVALPVAAHRRMTLLAQQLPPVRSKRLDFPCPLPTSALGGFALLSTDELAFAARRASPFPLGRVVFNEDRAGPPSRAYLKLWEALTLLGRRPGRGERCLDLGASPGGWTWVLQSLGAEVLAVDKADLAPAVSALPRVRHLAASAFALEPRDVGPVDWWVSDIICYPERLRGLVERWREALPRATFVVTVKFQGSADRTTLRALADVPGARVVHLWHNKHEVTLLIDPVAAPRTSSTTADTAEG